MPAKPPKVPPPLMPHEERLKLIRAPITFRTLGGKSYGGTFIDHDIPINGKRTFIAQPEDEAYIRYGRKD